MGDMGTEKNTVSPEKSFQVTDRRFWVEKDAESENLQSSRKKYPSYVEELKARTEAAEQKLRERIEQLETENAAFRSRLEKQIEIRLEATKAEFFKEFLEVADSLELALQQTSEHTKIQSFKEGIELTLGLLHRKFLGFRLEVIENLHKAFDPNESEAIGIIPVENPELDHKVVKILQKGYRMGDNLIRPARVQVGQFMEPEQD
jgi:molecular chaperone GrpE